MEEQSINGYKILEDAIRNMDHTSLNDTVIASMKVMQANDTFSPVHEAISEKLLEFEQLLNLKNRYDKSFCIYDNSSLKIKIEYESADIEQFAIRECGEGFNLDLQTALTHLFMGTPPKKKKSKYSPNQIIPKTDYTQKDIMQLKKAIYYHSQGAIDESWYIAISDFGYPEFITNMDEIIARKALGGKSSRKKKTKPPPDDLTPTDDTTPKGTE